jgi:hypothetical protein
VSFLPLADREFLELKQVKYQELPNENGQNWLWIDDFPVPPNLRGEVEGKLEVIAFATVVVAIPSGYNTTKLDSFYTRPRLKRVDGSSPQNTDGTLKLRDLEWQFWSRHLDDVHWRGGIDGLEVFFQYIAAALKGA